MRLMVSLTFALALIASAGSIAFAKGEKVSVCHTTSSETNPVVLIAISVNALDAHLVHGDFLPDENDSCEEDDSEPPIGPF